MFEGRIINWERLELKIASDVTKSITTGTLINSDAEHHGILHIYTAPNYGTPLVSESETWFDANSFAGWEVFLEMTVNSQFAANVTGYSLDIPSLGASLSGTVGAYSDSVNATLEIDNYKLYAHNSGVWRLRIGEMRFYVNGSLINTDSTGYTISGTTVLNPWSMPFLGLYPKMFGEVDGSAGQDFPSTSSPFGGVPDSWSHHSEIEQVLSGGIRWKENGTWYTLPTLELSPIMPTVTGGCSDPPLATISADTTWTTTLTQYFSFTENGAFCLEGINPITGAATVRKDTWIEVDIRTGSVWLWPNLTRQIVRATGDDYKALWFRWGFPWANSRGQKTYTNYSTPAPSLPPEAEDDQALETEIYGELSSLLSTVGNTSHTIEDPMIEDLYMPAWLVSTFSRSQLASDSRNYTTAGSDFPPDCPNPDFDPPDACDAQNLWQWPYSVEKVGDSGGQIPNVHKHKHPYVRLWSTWWNPHWSYSLFFPYDDAEDSYQWQINGSPAAAKLYWLLIAQQHITNPDLDESENIGTRNFVQSEPLDLGGFRDLIESTYFGQWTSWIGITRFHDIIPTIPSNKTLDNGSEDAWTPTDCSLSFGSDITVDADGTGAGTAIVELDIGRFLDSAYQYPYLCKKLFLDWVTTNISEVRVYIESISGERQLIENTPGDGFTTRNITYTLNDYDEEKYGGSWGQDFGAGFLSDIGTDSIVANGMSSSLMADNEKIYALSLLQTRHGDKLRFEIDVTDRTVNATLKYPKWELQAEDPTQLVENSSTTMLLFNEGPGTRIGQWSFWDYLLDSFTSSPVLRGPGNRMSALDILCLKRTVFEADDPQNGLDTEIATIYEGSGIEYTARQHLARDPIELRQTTLGMIVKGTTNPIVLLAISSLREPPPLAGFPYKSRDSEWAESGDHCQISYSFITEPRRYVKQGTVPIHLFDGSSNQWTADETVIAGWSVSKHSHEVDGSEVNFKLYVDTTEIADVRPWNGYFGVFTLVDTEGRQLDCIHFLATNEYYATYIIADDVYVRRNTFSLPVIGYTEEIQVTSTGDCEHPSLGVTPSGMLYLNYTRGTDIVYRFSHDQGRTWSNETTLIADSKYPRMATDRNGTIVWAAFKYISGTSGPGKIYIISFGPGELSIPSAIIAKDETGSDIEVEDDTFDISYSNDPHGRWLLFAKRNGETSPTHFTSSDHGKTYTEVYS